ncbi:MAG: hypothetical protein OEZ32_00725 [Nitrospinota bacterium]|nr:hypothetical protein [Nitrospinota bacterium]
MNKNTRYSIFAPLAAAIISMAGCHHNAYGGGAMAHHAPSASATHDESQSAEGHSRESQSMAPEGKLNLSPELKTLLAEEMRFIQQGMTELVPAIASGDSVKVADVATRMKESFILAKKLKPEQMKELHHSLPPGFVKMDTDFHDFSGMLASAAKAEQWNVVPYLYYRLSEGCMNCHATYAQERFPKLAGKATKFGGREGIFPLNHPSIGEEHGKSEAMQSQYPAMRAQHEAMKAEHEGMADCIMMKGKPGMHAGEDECPMMKDGKCAMTPEKCAAMHKGSDHQMMHMKEGTDKCPMMQMEKEQSTPDKVE